MKEAIKMVVFDMAGTTINENNIVYKTLQHVINDTGGYKLTLAEILEHGAGKEKFQAIQTVLKKCVNVEDEQLAEKIFQSFLQTLENAYEIENIYPNSNANELFTILNDMSILRVLNTGYDRKTAESLLKKLNWVVGRDIDALVTASDVPKNRPYPDMIDFARTKFAITDPELVVKIGDSIIDIQEGQNAGCALSIGITTGAHHSDQLKSANPDYIIDDLLEIVPIIEKYHTPSQVV
ncbi:HAD hydrolase-like protein [Sphingobacterium prati]|uniref:HAD hydrolase-like protein n=1 Tax=Sphingobacterium prati TaxID=2737006 RepID=UPI0015533536|nr:HAD hydrolase-like protein [Sphingobacterium prati]NPE47639.1 HAD hydrolase-like protein [Sphingobacterium prati]